MSGRVERLWLKRAHRGPMDEQDELTVVAGRGLVGGVDRSKRRQLTLLEREDWEAALREVGGDADPSRRRANVLVCGIDLAYARGRVIRVGRDVTLAIGGEVTPCERMEEVHPGLQNALRPDWRAGAFVQVVTGGVIRVGDAVEWVDRPAVPASADSLDAEDGEDAEGHAVKGTP